MSKQERVAEPPCVPGQTGSPLVTARPNWNEHHHFLEADGVGLITFTGLLFTLWYISLNSLSTQHTHHYCIVAVSKVTVLKALELCEVTAIPASTDPLVLSVTLDPATNAQLVPSLDL
jgi:hypothetical protein